METAIVIFVIMAAVVLLINRAGDRDAEYWDSMEQLIDLDSYKD
jgi:hypothetical protein